MLSVGSWTVWEPTRWAPMMMLFGAALVWKYARGALCVSLGQPHRIDIHQQGARASVCSYTLVVCCSPLRAARGKRCSSTRAIRHSRGALNRLLRVVPTLNKREQLILALLTEKTTVPPHAVDAVDEEDSYPRRTRLEEEPHGHGREGRSHNSGLGHAPKINQSGRLAQ